MDESSTKETKFLLYFPVCLDEDPLKSLNNDQRKFVVIGETIDVLLVAKYTGNEKEEEKISKWKSEVESLCSLANISTKSAGEENSHLTDLKWPIPENHNKLCQPFFSYKEDAKRKVVFNIYINDKIVIFETKTMNNFQF